MEGSVRMESGVVTTDLPYFKHVVAPSGLRQAVLEFDGQNFAGFASVSVFHPVLFLQLVPEAATEEDGGCN